MNIELKGTVGDKIAIIGTITQVTINENGVEYAYDISHEEDIKYIKDGDYIVPYKAPKNEVAEKIPLDKRTLNEFGDIEPEKPKKVKREKVMTTLGTNVPKQPTEPPIPKKRPGRPKKATVEGAMKKLEEMKARGEA